MLMESPFTHEIAGTFTDRVGAAGLDHAAFHDLMPRAAAALGRLRAQRSSGELPLLSLPGRRDDLAAWRPIVDRYRSQFDDVIVLGIGGSSLGGATLCRLTDSGFGPSAGAPRVRFLDNIDPWTFDDLMARLDLGRTGVLAISKSGGTAETVAQTLAMLDRLRQRIGKDDLATRVTCIAEHTDNPLRAIAGHYGLFCLDHDPKIGGRYSALSVTGLLPAAIAGVDVEAVRRGAGMVLDAALGAEKAEDAAPAAGAVINVGLASARNVSQAVIMPYVDRLERFGAWFRQLWAESLGKEGHGTTPIDAMGAVDQHSQLQLYLAGPRDKLFTLILADPAGHGPVAKPEVAGPAAGPLDYLMGRSLGDLLAAEQRATVETLIRNGCPTRVMRFPSLNEEVMGGLMMHFILETIIAADLLGIDPFDQPAVEESKVLARRYLREGME
ncbi:glucose-6-phosphate isomerase [Thalassobaculum fulvum]|uniref:Glucose-6-phosphate isomerase n=1 Tax=Thalassobaculum fulvum TaxID=1633335 RepID=A0A919CQR6_9PROT|nr:glucose-6-phosphate isomerase [Thalassobaculum fulvum]GHD56462.1 glucose-6-phosphate isomerase [Thalassobaculum fulvum]